MNKRPATKKQRQFEAAYSKALSLAQEGNYPAAHAAFRKSLRLDDSNVDARYNFALVSNLLGEHELAVSNYQAVLISEPDHVSALINLGHSFQQLGRLTDALSTYDRLVAIEPESAHVMLNRGAALLALQRFEEALASFDRVLQLKHDSPDALYNRGVALHGLRRFEEALSVFERVLSLAPANADALYNRGLALLDLRRLDEALISFGKVIDRDKNHADAHMNQSHVHLLRGNFAEGWPKHEWRRQIKRARSNRDFSKPLLSGLDDIAGKRVLVHSEQGLGDTIQFCRYLPLLEGAGATVLFAAQPSLKRLMQTLSGTVELVDLANETLEFDCYCPLLSLPLVFGADLSNIPRQVPYLHADPCLIEAWQAKIGWHGLKVGICWQGAGGPVDSGRSFPVRMFEGISGIADVRLISLHKGDGESQLAELPAGMNVETLGEGFDAGPNAFSDTAAVMHSLDLVITSDTAVAHLAGALARPVWVALKHVPDWRWMLDRDDSPWYPTMRIFRQRVDGDWQGVFTEIERTLLNGSKA